MGRVPQYQEAAAPGWRVVCLPNRVYPGLVPGQDEASGKVFTDLTEAEWIILDAFEDPGYTLAAVQLTTPLETDALTYIWRGEHADQSWSNADFHRDELADYLDRCHNWRRRYERSHC